VRRWAGRRGGRPFGQARQRIAVAQPLDGAGGWRCRASLGMDLRRTPGRMTLGQLRERLCLRGREPIGGPLRPGAVIRQGSLEGREGAVAPFLEDAAAHPEADGYVGHGFAPEQREDGVEPVFPGGAGGLWGRLHGGVLLLSRS